MTANTVPACAAKSTPERGKTDIVSLLWPADLEAERALLASMMLDASCIDKVAAILPPDKSRFYGPEHDRLYDVLIDLHGNGTPIDLVIVRDELTRRGMLERVGGVEYLVQLVESVPSAANASYYAENVRDKANLRDLKLACADTIRAVEAGGASGAELIRDALTRLEGLAQNAGDGMLSARLLTCMADIDAKEVAWLWPGKLPLACLTLLVGPQGVGKGFFAADAASRISTGAPWPDGTPCPRGSTIWISAEDDPETVLRPRLDAHNADVARIHLLRAVRRVDADGKASDVLFSLQDVGALEAAIQQVPDCKLIVIDPIGSFLGGRVDAHRDNEVRNVLTPVGVLAAKYQLAVLVVAHRRKASAVNADDLALGSRAFTGIARAVWHLSRDGQSPVRRYFLPGKMNLAPEAAGLAFSIIGDPIGRVTWEREPVRMNADQALAHEAAVDGDGGQGVRESAKEWLRDLLSGEPVPAREIDAQAKQAGFSLRTVRRAREELPIRVFKALGNAAGPWLWRLRGAQREDGHQDGQVPIGVQPGQPGQPGILPVPEGNNGG